MHIFVLPSLKTSDSFAKLEELVSRIFFVSLSVFEVLLISLVKLGNTFHGNK